MANPLLIAVVHRRVNPRRSFVRSVNRWARILLAYGGAPLASAGWTLRKLPNVPPEKVAQEGEMAGAADALARVRERLGDIGWYHTQELAPGLVTPGMFDLRPFVGHYGLPDDLTGKRALDIGTFEGFWAFEIERRGADVTAIDVDRIQDLDWPPRLRPDTDDRRGEGF